MAVRRPLRRVTTAACLLTAVALAGPGVVPATALPTPVATGTPVERSSAAQDAVDTARAAYDLARVRVESISLQVERLDQTAADANAEAQRLHDLVADEHGGFLSALAQAIVPGESDLDRATAAARNAQDAQALADQIRAALAESITAAEQARADWERAERRQARIEARWTANEYADAAIRRAALPTDYAVSDSAQDRRNRRALRHWQEYLRELADAAVVPPAASELLDPTRLPSGLRPLRDQRGEPSPGVAVADPVGHRAVPVVSAEAVRAVGEAFHRIGLGTVPGSVTPTAYACGGLVANSWTSPTVALPADAAEQYRRLRGVDAGVLQPGDIVVLGSRRDGLGQTALYVGRGQAVVADPATGTANVRPVPAEVLGLRRAATGEGRHRPAPVGGPCGATPATSVAGDGPLQLPMAAGSYHLSSGFGDSGTLWASGQHTGLDFAAPRGTPVYAAGAGTVTIEHPAWAGNLVRVDLGGGVQTLYAHLSRVDVTDGQVVAAGDPVGAVGSLGNTDGPHLHFEVRLDGTAYDPALVLDVPEAPPAEYPNGVLPDEALCPATAGGQHRLRCDAAVAYRLLAAKYADALGTDLCITDSYRSLGAQERAHLVKPGLTASPGTSQHGLGLAVDLCGGVERFGSPQNDWLLAHAPTYGWTHPAWAAPGGSKPEPWHWEYPA